MSAFLSSYSNVRFTLTLRERENYRLTVGESGSFRMFVSSTLLFPLPEGEGQGEGKALF